MPLKSKKFRMRDENFTCHVCGKFVPPLKYSARDHCPFCLYGQHLDDYPGDRASLCHGILEPIAIQKAKKQDYKIVYRCQKCGTIKKNLAARDDNAQLLLDLTQEPNPTSP
jgi:ribosome biogenesis GTPase